MAKFFKTFFISLIIFSVISAVGISVITYKDNSQEVDFADTFDREEQKDVQQEEITFLLMGVDSADGINSKGQRTDTMILCKYDSTTGKASMLSIPRDTKVAIEGRRKEEKINHAYAYGGSRLTLQTVNELLGTDINYYAVLNYNVVREFVDTIGGVEIDVPINMNYQDPVADPPLDISLRKGKQTLDGDKALQFLRYRKPNDGESGGYPDGDLGRINAQQQFMQSASKELLSPKNLLKLPKVVDSFIKNIETNIPKKLMLKYALDVKNLDAENIQAIVLPGEAKYIDNLWYYVSDKEESNKVIKNMFTDHEIVNKNKSIIND